MDASHDQMDRVDRARLVDSSGARADSPSWNLDNPSRRTGGQGQEDVKESESGYFRVRNEHKARTRTRAREGARPRSRQKVQKIGRL